MGYDIKTGEGKVNVEIETKVGIKNILTPDILMRCTSEVFCKFWSFLLFIFMFIYFGKGCKIKQGNRKMKPCFPLYE